jgi:hypothetical protein
MTDQLPGQAALEALLAVESETVRFADEIAASFGGFLDALPVIAREATAGQAISLLLLQLSHVSLAGARLGAQRDFAPREVYQPDVGPDADLDDLRMRLAELLGDLDTYGYVFDPYDADIVESQLSDDLTGIVSDLEIGMRHYRAGDVEEALWWWQFSYVSSWGTLAGAAQKAMISVIAHDRLDVELPSEIEQIEAAEAALNGADVS